jgi:hypothetical protein
MQVYHVTAASLDQPGVLAEAFVVADSPDEALLLLRKDFNFSGYRLPPIEMTGLEASRDEVRRLFGDTAPTEKGVYGFTGVQAPAATTR